MEKALPVIALTDLAIRHLKPEPGKQITFFDRTLKGFGVRVGAESMTYVLVYGPNRTRVKLGEVGIVRLAEARQAARMLLAERQLGQEPSKGQTTYQEALSAFLEASKAKNKARTVRDYTRLLTRHGFGAEKLSDITARAVQRKLDRLADTPSEQAHAQAALKIFFAHCVRRHLIDASPMARVDRARRTQSRARVLSEEELVRVWNACEGMFGTIVRLCFLTGQRRSEIAQMTADMIEGDCIRFPPSLTKNGREHLFPVGTIAQEILKELPKEGYLFPARKTWRAGGTVYNAWNKDKPKLDKASGVTGWVIHDARRTLVSSWAALHIRLEVTEKYVNHVSGSHGGVQGIYLRHSFLPEMREAAQRWNDHLADLLARE
jgi:integrase